MIMMMLSDSERPVTIYVKAAVFSAVLAVVAEVAQIPGPRKAEIADLLADALGILAFLGMAAILDNRGSNRFPILRCAHYGAQTRATQRDLSEPT